MRYRAVVRTVSGDAYQTKFEELSIPLEQSREVLDWFFENVLSADSDWLTIVDAERGVFSFPESQIASVTVIT